MSRRIRQGIDRAKEDMPHLIQFKRPNENDNLGPEFISVKNGEVYANIREASGREIFDASQAQQEISHMVKIWYPNNFTVATDWRITASIGYGHPGQAVRTRILRVEAVLEPDLTAGRQMLKCKELTRDNP